MPRWATAVLRWLSVKVSTETGCFQMLAMGAVVDFRGGLGAHRCAPKWHGIA